MMLFPDRFKLAVALFASMAPLAHASAQSAPAPAPAAAPSKPDPLVIYFQSGSAAIHDETELDHAARLFRDGNPIVMIVSGGTDAVGSPVANLQLSETRAKAVLRALIARGIPAERFQVLAKGETDPAVAAPNGEAEARNRRVEISWR
jgi:outer membrane protein OmpA-like peptidoglycan-associated protein